MENIRAKIKRRFSRHEKNPNLDDYDSADEDTQSYLQKEIEKAEEEGHPEGRPGSLLNRLISHGNKKTEEQMQRDMAARQASANQESSKA